VIVVPIFFETSPDPAMVADKYAAVMLSIFVQNQYSPVESCKDAAAVTAAAVPVDMLPVETSALPVGIIVASDA